MKHYLSRNSEILIMMVFSLKKFICKNSSSPHLLLCVLSDPDTYQKERPLFKIENSVRGTSITTRFGPILDNEGYCVCIVKENQYDTCVQKNLLDSVSTCSTYNLCRVLWIVFFVCCSWIQDSMTRSLKILW